MKHSAVNSPFPPLSSPSRRSRRPAAADAGRYVMEKTEEGYVRMDTATGEMSICTEKSGQLVCKLAADERAAFQDALDRLEDRVARLEDRVERTLAYPSEQEFEQGLDNMEKFFRRFLGIVEEYDRDRKAPAEPEAPADRT
jgi:hypothetical protein